MTGAQLLAYTKQRLAEQGLTVEGSRTAELYDSITEARDEIRQRLAMSQAGSLAVRETVTLEAGDTERLYTVPEDTTEPIRVLAVRVPGKTAPLHASLYSWTDLRTVQLACGYGSSAGLELVAVLRIDDAIDGSTAEADVGLPVSAHRACGKLAAALALTVDEESDASVAMALYEREMQRLEALFADRDINAGSALGDALLEGYYEHFGDMIP